MWAPQSQGDLLKEYIGAKKGYVGMLGLGFTKAGTAHGVPIIRTTVFWDLNWGPPVFANEPHCHILRVRPE